MNEESGAIIGFLLILAFVCGFGFFIGFLIGTENSQSSIRQSLCKQICTATNDYINCNTKSLNEIIQRINPPDVLRQP